MRVVYGFLGTIFPCVWLFAIGYSAESWMDYSIRLDGRLGAALWAASLPIFFLSVVILIGGTVGLWYLALRRASLERESK